MPTAKVIWHYKKLIQFHSLKERVRPSLKRETKESGLVSVQISTTVGELVTQPCKRKHKACKYGSQRVNICTINWGLSFLAGVAKHNIGQFHKRSAHMKVVHTTSEFLVARSDQVS